jgi:hypothetical protein
VYFGKLKPLETPSAIVLLDPALPGWVRDAVGAMVPASAAFYTKEYGVGLPEKPFFFMVWKPVATGWTIHGDTLPGVVDMDVGGDFIRHETPRGRMELGKILAHEFAHLWNAYRFQPSDAPEGGGYWLDEGQAEASALQASVHLGWMSAQDADRRRTAYVNQCFQSVNDAPLVRQNHDRAVIYGCGVTLQMLAEAAVSKAHPQASPFLLWRDIYAAAGKQDDKYSAALFTRELAKLADDKALAERIDVFATQSVKGKDAFILARLKQLGFGFKTLHQSTGPRDTAAAARFLFSVLMQADCKRSISFSTTPDAVRIYPLKRCKFFNKPYRITAVDGHALYKEAFPAYHAVQKACIKPGARIRFGLAHKKGEADMACPAHIPDLPPIVKLESVPWRAGAMPAVASRKAG